MLRVALLFAFTAVALAMLLNLYRLLRGPGLPDRIVALDTLYINTIALVMLIGIQLSQAVFFEVGLLVAMMGFVGTVALCKHVVGRSIIE
jgi:multicomponent K+:H+ antiporter subunit F